MFRLTLIAVLLTVAMASGISAQNSTGLQIKPQDQRSKILPYQPISKYHWLAQTSWQFNKISVNPTISFGPQLSSANLLTQYSHHSFIWSQNQLFGSPYSPGGGLNFNFNRNNVGLGFWPTANGKRGVFFHYSR